MNKRGIILIFTLLVLVVFSILSASFFLKSMNENNLVRRNVNSIQALWLAEAGVAEAFRHLPDSPLSGNVSNNERFLYNTTTVEAYSDIYRINSTGTVVLPDLSTIQRSVMVYVKTTPYNSSNFPKAIEVNGELDIGGSANITPVDSWSEYANLSFADKFGFSTEELKAYAMSEDNYYLDPDPNDVVVVDEITWVDVTDGKSMITQTGWEGSGLLIVNGDADITGGNFTGIIWVIGTLRMSGNPQDYGAIFAECDAEIDTKLTGNVYVEHNTTAIQDALDLLTLLRRDAVSWNEINNP